MIYKYVAKKRSIMLTCAVLSSLGVGLPVANAQDSDINVTVETNFAQEDAKYDSQQKQVITSKDIEQKQAKSVEDIVFNETGVSRTVDGMGRVGVSLRGADPRHTLILVDGQPAMGDFAKYTGQGDELMRLGAENLDRIEITKGAASAKYGSGAIGGVINVVTKKPGDKPQFKFNMESLRLPGESGIAPYSNFYLRADSGKVGKTAFSIYGSKREVLPVYAAKERLNKGLIADDLTNFEKNSLRFSGLTSNIGVSGKMEFDDKNNMDVRFDRYDDNLYRYIKHTKSITEPAQQFKRDIDRKTVAINFNGQLSEATNYNAEINYTKMHEDDITLLNYEGHSAYKGTDEIKYLDNVDHQQYSVKLNATTAVNDKHMLNYGIGMTREKGEGSRLKNAPKQTVKSINPWDYSKNLQVTKNADDTYSVNTSIHDYKLYKDKDGKPLWDNNFEWYGYNRNDGGKTEKPAFSYQEYYPLAEKNIANYKYKDILSTKSYKNYLEFGKQLKAQNPAIASSLTGDEERIIGQLVDGYFKDNPVSVWNEDYSEQKRVPVLFNGKKFKEIYKELDNKVTIGEAHLNKEYVYIEDNWQMDENNTLTPSIRLDHSNLFGSNMTFNLGLTHNLKGDPNKRLKANIGTGYSEPGLGELYYNWEMYSGIPISGGFGGGIAKMGWYWQGNPNLKPEKSVNVDLSYEIDTKKDNFKASLFRNSINNYLSVYFTGGILDFYPEDSEKTISGGAKYLHAPDLIYSFKNIGKAEITGFETEIKHKFSDKWSGRLGYTYLHAINKSDPSMPERLLDKPKHKIDIGVNYDDKKTGWSGSLYANYYIDLIDSNEISGNGNILESYPLPNGLGSKITTSYENKTYKRKTYGLWNFIVQKKFKDDTLAYFAIDNLFNHRDDARALQARVFRFGVNFKFGSDGKIHSVTKDAKGNEIDLGPVELTNFLNTPFDTNQKEGFELIGQYSLQSNWHTGSNRPAIRITEDSFIGSAEKNLLDNKDQGVSQKLVTGFNYRKADTNLKVLASLNSNSAMDTAIDTSKNKGLNHFKLEEADLTQKAKKWNLSVGKLKEKLGETGYYFNNSFVGARAVWTGKKTQVRVGYGDFHGSTGINDSAYTTTKYQSFMRPPTINELLGTFDDYYLAKHPELKEILINNPNLNFKKQFAEAVKNSDTKKQFELVNKLYDIVSQAYPNGINKKNDYINISFPEEAFKYTTDKKVNDTITETHIQKTSGEDERYDDQVIPNAKISSIRFTPDGTATQKLYNELNASVSLSNRKPIENYGTAFIDDYVKDHKDKILEAFNKVAKGYMKDDDFSDETLSDIFYWNNPSYRIKDDDPETPVVNDNDDDDEDYYGWYRPRKLSKQEKREKLAKYIAERKEAGQFVNKKFVGFVNNDAKILDDVKNESLKTTNIYNEPKLIDIVDQYKSGLESVLKDSEDGTPFPRFPLGVATGVNLPAYGIVVNADNIPSIDRALFIDVKHEITPRLGISAWYLGSSKNNLYTYETANADHKNDVHKFDDLAKVFGVGLKYQLAPNASLSFDAGKNYTKLGKFLNGSTDYSYANNNTEVNVVGKKTGSAPLFYTLRFDIGNADFNTKGSWSGFADYKYFEHGSFFGGNGTGSLPDRYLDGIRSFTIGGAYVPRKNLMLNVSYTFGAEGINKRDTLFGPEKFKLGNYSRIEMLYKF